MRRRVEANGVSLDYELTRKAVKNINLRVKRDGSVCVSAPKAVSVQRVDEFVCKNMGFILKSREKLAYIPEKKQDTVYLLGKPYHLVMRSAQRSRVYIEGDDLIVETAKAEEVQRIIEAYEDDLAGQLFPEIVLRMLPLVKAYGVNMPRITVRRMTTRWGSCTPARGTIRLNRRLVRYPVECIEQVALHELCHFVHPDHSKDFYALMTRLMPDWKQRKALLEKRME